MFKKIIDAIAGFFTKEAPVLENALSKAITFTNIVKTFLGSATGQTIEAILEALLPGAGTVIINALNLFFKDFGLITDNLNGTPAQQVAEGLSNVAKLTGDSRIHALSVITAIVANKGDNATGGTSTPQQTLAAVPVAYNPDILSVNPTLPASAQVSQAQLDLEKQQLAQGGSPNGN